MIKHKIHGPVPPFKSIITTPNVGTGEPTPVEVFAVACYPGEQIAFWVRGEGGWLYCYVPLMWLPHKLNRPKAYPAPAAFDGFAVDTPPCGEASLGGEKVEALFVIDFLQANDLAWVVRHADGSLAVVQHRRFDAVPPPGGIRGLADTWLP